MEWPQWKENKQLMNIFANSGKLLKDDFRSDTYDFITKNVASLHI
jgi:triacylglycerol lipase